MTSSEQPAILRPVLDLFPACESGWRATQVLASAGFSDASVWRVQTGEGIAFALKRHPPRISAGDIRQSHDWMTLAHGAGLLVVPRVELTRAGTSVPRIDGATWELSTWMPGQADFYSRPSDPRLLTVMQTLATLHRCWSLTHSCPPQICPSVLRRLAILQRAVDILIQRDSDLRKEPTLLRAASLIRQDRTRMLSRLQPWATRRVRVQPIIGDLWHDHLLFEGDRLTGIIDYSAARIDAPEAELARLLGSLIPGQATRQQVALSAYLALAPLAKPTLVNLLEVTGWLAALANWIDRWPGIPVEQRARALTRIENLCACLGGESHASGLMVPNAFAPSPSPAAGPETPGSGGPGADSGE